MRGYEKYSEAIRLYEESDLSLTEIAARCNISRKAFSAYICRSRRDLLMKRNGSEADPATKLRGSKGQRQETHDKYREAVLACDSMEFIELNISEIARRHDLNPSALANQLRNHYPEVLQRRDAYRQRQGIADSTPRGVRKTSNDKYAPAVADLQQSDLTIQEAAEKHDVSFTGLRQHLLFYHKDLVEEREKKRISGKLDPKIGAVAGNGRLKKAKEETTERFAEAVEMYRTTTLPATEIARRTGVDVNQFRYYLKKWHRKLIFERHGVTPVDDTYERRSLKGVKQYSAATAEKYAEAIEELRKGEKSTECVAKEYGFVPEVFRAYLREHEPEMYSVMGMMETEDGKRTLRRTSEKYGEALELHRKEGGSLRSIAQRLGLNYTSLSSYVRRLKG